MIMRSKETDKKRKLCQVTPLYKSPAINTNILSIQNGYSTQPSLKQIVEFNFIVSSFRVSNGKTSIEWQGVMDLRTHIPTTLAELIDLGDDYVEVYRNGAHTPRVGSGFNRECLATFTNGREYARRCKSYPQLLKKLGKLCRLNDCQLVSFDIETGQWQIRIQHFTKLKFEVDKIDSDESEEEQGPPIIAPLPSVQTAHSLMTLPNLPNQERFMQLDEALTPDTFTSKITVSDKTYRDVGNFNNIITKQKGIVNKWWQLRCGGSGMKFSIQRGRRGFKVTSSRTQQHEPNELTQLIKYGLSVDSLPALIRSSTVGRYKFTLTLLHILFTRTIQNAIKYGEVVTAESNFTFKEALKSWFQTKTSSGTYVGQDQILKALSKRDTDSLVNKLISEGQFNLAQVVTKLQDPLFRQMYVIPNDCRGPLQQILMGVFSQLPGQTWVDALAISLWYNNQSSFPQRILKACDWFKEPKDQQELRILRLYGLKRLQQKGQKSMTIFDRSTSQDILNWAITNILAQVETDVINETALSTRRCRQLFNLMSKLPTEAFKKILKADNFIKSKQKMLGLYFNRLIPESGKSQPVNLVSIVCKGEEGYLSVAQKKSVYQSLKHATDEKEIGIREYLGVDLGILPFDDQNIEMLLTLAQNTTRRQQNSILQCIYKRLRQNESHFRCLLNLNEELARRLSKVARQHRNPAIASYIDILRL